MRTCYVSFKQRTRYWKREREREGEREGKRGREGEGERERERDRERDIGGERHHAIHVRCINITCVFELSVTTDFPDGTAHIVRPLRNCNSCTKLQYTTSGFKNSDK